MTTTTRQGGGGDCGAAWCLVSRTAEGRLRFYARVTETPCACGRQAPHDARRLPVVLRARSDDGRVCAETPRISLFSWRKVPKAEGRGRRYPPCTTALWMSFSGEPSEASVVHGQWLQVELDAGSAVPEGACVAVLQPSRGTTKLSRFEKPRPLQEGYVLHRAVRLEFEPAPGEEARCGSRLGAGRRAPRCQLPLRFSLTCSAARPARWPKRDPGEVSEEEEAGSPLPKKLRAASPEDDVATPPVPVPVS